MRKIFAVLAALICCLSVWTSVPAAQAFTLDKEDGEYSIQVELEGGSGKASVTSPTLITVKNGEVTADIQWSSSNYDYMIVDGKKYLPVNEEGTNSEFQIPVTIMDESMPVIADTTAMGTPHEINYTLTFYSDSIGSKSQMPQSPAPTAKINRQLKPGTYLIQLKHMLTSQISLLVPTLIFGPKSPTPDVTILCIFPFFR